METIINTISDWPVIIQGALGSALFALILFIGQKITIFTGNVLSSYSSNAKEEKLNLQWQKYSGLKAFLDGDKNLSTQLQVGLLYQASRSLITGLIWLGLGLIFSNFINTLGIVGYIGFIYYLFKALSCVQKVDRTIPPQERLKEIEEQLTALKLNKNKQNATS